MVTETRLLTLAETNHLYIMNSMFATKDIHRETWYMRTGFKKRTDYILTEDFIKRRTSHCRVYRKASVPFDSDHRLLVLTCYLPSKAERLQERKKRSSEKQPSLHVKKLVKDRRIQIPYSKISENILKQNMTTIDQTDINEIERTLVDSLNSAARAAITKQENPTKEWVNDEFLALIDRERTCKSPEKKKALRKEIKKYGKKSKNSFSFKMN